MRRLILLLLFIIMFKNKKNKKRYFSPIKFKPNKLIKFSMLPLNKKDIDLNYTSNKLKYIKNKYSTYGIILDLKNTYLDLDKIFENTFNFLHPKQIHFINCSNMNIDNNKVKYLFDELDKIYFKNNIPVSIMVNNNNLSNIDFLNEYNISNGSLLHIQNNNILNLQSIFNSNFEIMKFILSFLMFLSSIIISLIAFKFSYKDKSLK